MVLRASPITVYMQATRILGKLVAMDALMIT